PVLGAVAWLLDAAQDEPADARGRLARRDRADIVDVVGIPGAVGLGDAIAGLRDRADAAPVAIDDVEYVGERRARRRVALARDVARIRVLDGRLAALELAHRDEHAAH